MIGIVDCRLFAEFNGRPQSGGRKWPSSLSGCWPQQLTNLWHEWNLLS